MSVGLFRGGEQWVDINLHDGTFHDENGCTKVTLSPRQTIEKKLLILMEMKGLLRPRELMCSREYQLFVTQLVVIESELVEARYRNVLQRSIELLESRHFSFAEDYLYEKCAEAYRNMGYFYEAYFDYERIHKSSALEEILKIIEKSFWGEHTQVSVDEVNLLYNTCSDPKKQRYYGYVLLWRRRGGMDLVQFIKMLAECGDSTLEMFPDRDRSIVSACNTFQRASRGQSYLEYNKAIMHMQGIPSPPIELRIVYLLVLMGSIGVFMECIQIEELASEDIYSCIEVFENEWSSQKEIWGPEHQIVIQEHLASLKKRLMCLDCDELFGKEEEVGFFVGVSQNELDRHPYYLKKRILSLKVN